MPYLKQSDKTEIDTWGKIPSTTGELTYVLYKACLEYLKNSEGRFQHHSEVIAALECAKLEFYRQHVAPYEDGAIQRNGDVR